MRAPALAPLVLAPTATSTDGSAGSLAPIAVRLCPVGLGVSPDAMEAFMEASPVQEGGNPMRRLKVVLVVVLVALTAFLIVVAPAGAVRSRFTGFQVSGQTSTFGWPLEFGASGGVTWDEGSTFKRPCIAIRSTRTVDHAFQVTVWTHPFAGVTVRHSANMIQCDWGPAAWTKRFIDITGAGVYWLKLNPWTYPTGHVWGHVRELARVPPELKRLCSRRFSRC